MVDYDPEQLLVQAKQSNRVALAKLISIVERGGGLARELTRLTWGQGEETYLVGITGAPGAGKSTLTDRLISVVRNRSLEVAVLAVDPTSPFSGGAILGDRIRMQDHATDKGVYIRSMATRGQLGGLALAVPEATRVLAAVKFPYVFIETVGVGQVEVEIVGAADTTAVVMTPGWGDSIQANKAGLMEVADLFIINKSDRDGTRETRRDIELMLEMSSFEDWIPPIIETVATGGSGIEETFEAIESHREYLERSGVGQKRREARILDELNHIVQVEINRKVDQLISQPSFSAKKVELINGDIDPYSLARELLKIEDD
ncbi:MAG: methylmalonyl Co-A mutase-associated GTPase MeaB [Acidimicrobiaceae bacterium]|nr:methylmalonyl Co-A mutase-associated GTPase MeaB [Acidimicrobiaceae bacterium]